MAEAAIIDGRVAAARLRARLRDLVGEFGSTQDVVPGLAVVQVGDNPASSVYVRGKARATVEVGMKSIEHKLPEDVSESSLLAVIRGLNDDPAVHGFLVQLPLPARIRPQAVVDAIDPAKDVDGFHPLNVGRLVSGGEGLVPCTPQGCLMLIRDSLDRLAGQEAVVLGRSNIVGKPMAALLLREDCTVTTIHTKSRDLPQHCRRADILVVAAGRAGLVRGDWIKPGAVVIDVGMNRGVGADGKPLLLGDVDFDEAMDVASAITPVPGGVGPMTIACLLRNTMIAYCRQRGLPVPEI